MLNLVLSGTYYCKTSCHRSCRLEWANHIFLALVTGSTPTFVNHVTPWVDSRSSLTPLVIILLSYLVSSSSSLRSTYHPHSTQLPRLIVILYNKKCSMSKV